MNDEPVNPILTNSGWHSIKSLDAQIVPHSKRPGEFVARLVVKGAGWQRSKPPRMIREINGCAEVSRLELFLESPHAGQHFTTQEEAQAAAILSPIVAKTFAAARFPNGCAYSLIAPGRRPPEPLYPLWARDEQRSRQVLAGNYTEISPIWFEFVPTLNCIFRCHECAYRIPKERLGIWQKNNYVPQFHMDFATMVLLLDKLRAAEVYEVLFTGGGEPLLNEYTPKAMQYAAQIGIPRIGLYTNGALITQAKAQALLAAMPGYIRVSLNAGTKTQYQRHHNPLRPAIDFFARTRAGIEHLAQAKHECGSTTSLGISYLVDAENTADMVEAARLMAAIAARYPRAVEYMRFTPSVNYFGPTQHGADMFDAAVDTVEREVAPILGAAGIRLELYRHRFRGLYEPRTYTECRAASLYGGVGPGGTLYWCCEKLFNPDFAFGSLRDHSLGELWTSPERAAVLRHVSQAVRGGTNSPCPVVCKPHEQNKVFAQVERLRSERTMDAFAAWIQQIHVLKQRQPQGAQVFNAPF
jgi:MoaA/NifB/PqqE/SkfB family radical SAM enzyme